MDRKAFICFGHAYCLVMLHGCRELYGLVLFCMQRELFGKKRGGGKEEQDDGGLILPVFFSGKLCHDGLRLRADPRQFHPLLPVFLLRAPLYQQRHRVFFLTAELLSSFESQAILRAAKAHQWLLVVSCGRL